MSINISIVADGTKDDVVAYIRSVAEAIDEGRTHGEYPDGRHWEIDDYADEERGLAQAWPD